MERNPNQMRYGMNQRAYTQNRSCQSRMPAANTAAVNRAAQESCGCQQQPQNPEPCQFPVAMAYVPWQTFENTYNQCEGLMNGTIFPELNLPFERGRCQRR